MKDPGVWIVSDVYQLSVVTEREINFEGVFFPPKRSESVMFDVGLGESKSL